MYCNGEWQRSSLDIQIKTDYLLVFALLVSAVHEWFYLLSGDSVEPSKALNMTKDGTSFVYDIYILIYTNI